MPPSEQIVTELTQGWFRRNIVANDGLRLAQRPAGRPPAIGHPLARREPDRLDVAFLAAIPRDNFAIQCLRVDHTDPRHSECARFNRNLARFLEQRVPIVHANDQRIDAAQHGVDATQASDPVLRLQSMGDVLKCDYRSGYLLPIVTDGSCGVFDRKAGPVLAPEYFVLHPADVPVVHRGMYGAVGDGVGYSILP